MIGAEWKDRCPSCGAQEAETRIHFWLFCPKWASQRERYLRRMIDYYTSFLTFPIIEAELTQTCTVGMLLGGSPAGVNPGPQGPVGEAVRRAFKAWSEARREGRTEFADRVPRVVQQAEPGLPLAGQPGGGQGGAEHAELEPHLRERFGGGKRSVWGRKCYAPWCVWVAQFLDEVWPARLRAMAELINAYEPMPEPVGQLLEDEGAAGT